MMSFLRCLAWLLPLILTACGLGQQMPTSGPSAESLSTWTAHGYEVREITSESKHAMSSEAIRNGLERLPPPKPQHDEIMAGDQLDLSIWEASPAVLLGAIGSEAANSAGGRGMSSPVQVVAADGSIMVPFLGRLRVVGRSPRTVEGLIEQGLAGKANRPKVLVRVNSNVSQEITVVGGVTHAIRFGLTPRRERLLDAIAQAGGVSMPLEKATVQVSRSGTSVAVALERVIREPAQNIVLSAGDLVTLYHLPLSFVAWGAVAKPGEQAFEATGLSLAQALARAGGPVDSRADPGGLFLARLEAGNPTIYRLDLRQPGSFFALRSFQVQHEDVIYLANAPGAEWQKFLSLLGSAVYPLDAAMRNLGPPR